MANITQTSLLESLINDRNAQIKAAGLIKDRGLVFFDTTEGKDKTTVLSDKILNLLKEFKTITSSVRMKKLQIEKAIEKIDLSDLTEMISIIQNIKDATLEQMVSFFAQYDS